MQYIPTSQLINRYETEWTTYLPLPLDIIRVILSYYEPLLSPIHSVYYFWYHIGVETCNLRKWRFYCSDILQKSFGLTRFKFVSRIEDLLRPFASDLDELVCKYYPEYNTDLFYGSETIIPYPVQKYKKTLTQSDKQYILAFIERCNTYIHYFVQHTLPVYVSHSEKKKLFKTIDNIKKVCDKMSIIHEIKVIQK